MNTESAAWRLAQQTTQLTNQFVDLGVADPQTTATLRSAEELVARLSTHHDLIVEAADAARALTSRAAAAYDSADGLQLDQEAVERSIHSAFGELTVERDDRRHRRFDARRTARGAAGPARRAACRLVLTG